MTSPFINKAWMPKGMNESRSNPKSPQSDNYCEKIYKSFLDSTAPQGFNEKVVKLAEILDIDL
jgi:hypothetical protein